MNSINATTKLVKLFDMSLLERISSSTHGAMDMTVLVYQSSIN